MKKGEHKAKHLKTKGVATPKQPFPNLPPPKVHPSADRSVGRPPQVPYPCGSPGENQASKWFKRKVKAKTMHIQTLQETH